MQRTPKHSISVRLDLETYNRLVQQASSESRSLNFIVTTALRQFVAVQAEHERQGTEAN